jgi:hypothetical protein
MGWGSSYPTRCSDFPPQARMQVTLDPSILRTTLPAHGPSGTTPSRSCACRSRGGAAVALIASCVALRPPGGSPSTPQGAARAAAG